MELMINFILGLMSSICIGLTTNYIYDKIKNHSSSANRKVVFYLNSKLNSNSWKNSLYSYYTTLIEKINKKINLLLSS